MKRSLEEATHLTPAKKIKLSNVLDFLVTDTLKLILSKLDPKSQRHARLVCTQWFNIINLSEFNIGALYYYELPSVISVLSRYNKPLSVSFKNLDQIKDVSVLSQLTNVTKLHTNINDRHNVLFSKLTDLQSLTTNIISTDVFESLKKLTYLSCKKLKLAKFRGPFTQIEELEITEKQFKGSFNNDFPNLKHLEAEGIEDECRLTRLESLSIIHDVTTDAYPITLTKLFAPVAFIGDKQKFRSALATLTRLKVINLDESTQIKDILLKFPCLESCNVRMIEDDGTKVWQDLAKLKHLTELSVDTDLVPNEESILLLTGLLALTIDLSNAIALDDVSGFSSLVNLTRLVVFKHGMGIEAEVKGYTALTALTALQHLEIMHYIKESFMNDMTKLTRLQLSLHKDILTPYKHCFTKISNLLELDIQKSRDVELSDVIDGFDKLMNVTKLFLRTNVSDNDWCLINKMTNLVDYFEFNFSGNKQRAAMRHLTSLNAQLNSYDIDHLTKLTRLQRLFVAQSFKLPIEDKEKLRKIVESLPLYVKGRSSREKDSSEDSEDG